MKPLGLRRLLKLSAVLMVLRVTGAVLALVLQAALARWFGVGELGIYALTIAVAGTLSIIIGLGYPAITPRFVPAFLEAGESGLLAGFIRSGRAHLAAMSAIVWAGALIVFLLPDALISRDIRLALGFGALAAPLMGLIELNGALAISFRLPMLSFLPDLLLKQSLMLLAVTVLAWLMPQPDILPVLAALLAIMLVLSGGQMLILSRLGRSHLTAARPASARPEWRRAALPMTLVVILTSFVGDLDLLFLAILLPTEDIAIFSICFRFSMFLSFGVQVVYHLLMPDLSAAYAGGRIGEIGRKLRWANGLTIAFTAAATGLAMLGGQHALALFGPEFLPGHAILVVLMAVQMLAALFGPNAQFLNLSGNQMKMIPIFASGLALLAILNLALVPWFNLFGAAMAFFLAALFWHGRLAITVYRECGLHCSVLTLLRQDKPSAAIG